MEWDFEGSGHWTKYDLSPRTCNGSFWMPIMPKRNVPYVRSAQIKLRFRNWAIVKMRKNHIGNWRRGIAIVWNMEINLHFPVSMPMDARPKPVHEDCNNSSRFQCFAENPTFPSFAGNILEIRGSFPHALAGVVQWPESPQPFPYLPISDESAKSDTIIPRVSQRIFGAWRHRG